ncbi:hypothetical protein TWF281_003780 [Arthrobotrys megalospora]
MSLQPVEQPGPGPTSIPPATILQVLYAGNTIIFDDEERLLASSAVILAEFTKLQLQSDSENISTFRYYLLEFSYDALDIFTRYLLTGAVTADNDIIDFATLREVYDLTDKLAIPTGNLRETILHRWRNMVDFSNMQEVVPLLICPIRNVKSRQHRFDKFVYQFYHEMSEEVDLKELRQCRMFKRIRRKNRLLWSMTTTSSPFCPVP